MSLLLMRRVKSSLLESLVASWRLDEASGARADATGRGNTLTDNNTVTQAAGRVGSAGQFTRANSEFLSLAHNADVAAGNVDWTFTAWTYLDSKPGSTTMGIANKGASGGAGLSDAAWQAYYDTNQDRFEADIFTDGLGAAVNVPATTFGAASTATWYLLAIAYDAANNLLQISVNAGAYDTAAATNGNEGTGPFEIGRAITTPTYWDGRIDAANFHRKVLTVAELTELYNGGAGREHPF